MIRRNKNPFLEGLLVGMFSLFLVGALYAETKPVYTESQKPAPELTEVGKKLEVRYAADLAALRKEIAESLPTLDARETVALGQAAQAQAAANAARGNLLEIEGAKGLVDHAKGKWIGGAERGIAAARLAIKNATSDAEREAAEKDLAKWQENKEQGLAALKERQAAYEKIRVGAAAIGKANGEAEEALTKARADEVLAADEILARLRPFLSGASLDAKLAKCSVLATATPRGLAMFAQQGADKEALVEQLLADSSQMKEMLTAGGARRGRYGQAMEIFTAIRKASARANEGHFRSLALAVALEHAVPITQSNPKGQTDAPATVDPVKRYLHYEQAHLDGELDSSFGDFGTWEYRMVVNCDAPDETLAWGREMLRNYRPDLIRMANRAWRYSLLVKTDILFSDEKFSQDLPSLQNHQNILMNGGTCGRRAFFGRFILRSFGIPVWGVTQKGHAAAGRWTPDGWVVNLGAGFEWSWWGKGDAPRTGEDFLRETEARRVPNGYLRVLRLRWISDALGEKDRNERTREPGGIWSVLAHYENLAVAKAGKELSAAQATAQDKPEEANIPEADRTVKVTGDGMITIPAAAVLLPNGNTPQLMVMKGHAGGALLHCARELKNEVSFEYTLDAPQTGKYALAATIVTVHSDQKLLLTLNEAEEPFVMSLSYTYGQLGQTDPVEVALSKGKNVLRLTRPAPSEGMTILDFTLKPLR